MRHQRFPGQTKYPNGETMCTTACVCMCIAILSGRLRGSRSFPSLVHEVMSTSGVIQGFLRSRYGLGLTSVHDVLRNGGMRRHTQQIDVDEKAILPAGFVDRGNQEGDDDDFLVTLQGITNVISQRKFAIFTCLGHSTCAFYTPDDQYCFFDPAPACIIADMSREQLHGMLRSNRQIGGSQCDVTLLSLRSGQS